MKIKMNAELREKKWKIAKKFKQGDQVAETSDVTSREATEEE